MNRSQLFYTEEGKTYRIRTISKTLQFINGNPSIPQPLVYINPDPLFPVTSLPYIISFETPKKIIPIQLNFGVVTSTSILIDISSVYYSVYRGLLSNLSNDQIKPLCKIAPLIQRIFYTSESFYGYNFRYTNALFTEADFINTNGITTLNFVSELSGALNNQPSTALLLPLGAMKSTITFSFFELQ